MATNFSIMDRWKEYAVMCNVTVFLKKKSIKGGAEAKFLPKRKMNSLV